MRRFAAVLVIGIGAGVLILARLVIGPEACDPNPSFFERGTYADCEARNPKKPEVPQVLVAEQGSLH